MVLVLVLADAVFVPKSKFLELHTTGQRYSALVVSNQFVILALLVLVAALLIVLLILRLLAVTFPLV